MWEVFIGDSFQGPEWVEKHFFKLILTLNLPKIHSDSGQGCAELNEVLVSSCSVVLSEGPQTQRCVDFTPLVEPPYVSPSARRRLSSLNCTGAQQSSQEEFRRSRMTKWKVWDVLLLTFYLLKDGHFVGRGLNGTERTRDKRGRISAGLLQPLTCESPDTFNLPRTGTFRFSNPPVHIPKDGWPLLGHLERSEWLNSPFRKLCWGQPKASSKLKDASQLKIIFDWIKCGSWKNDWVWVLVRG